MADECYKVTTICGGNFIVKDIGNSMCEIHCLTTEHKEIVEHPQTWFAKHNYKIDQIKDHKETVC